ncbi:hypothetical protein DPMN_194844 [Dreissena polymorpha]|uniref:Uncharacterized protein n=1 Tax=Dreissena polymorpha TaxID=45954 RepID=A0A9D3Y5S6_DREPO|nr:hypothetical protein DPMN_194844 [Dreissena polymorpha]
MFFYIGRPLMNVTVDLFDQKPDQGSFSRHGHFLKITVCHESQNRSSEVKNVDDCVDHSTGNKIVAANTEHCCEDCMDDKSITFVFMSATFLGKRKNIQFEALVTLGLCIEFVMIVCFLFATVVANSLEFSTADLTTFFYSTTV